MKIHRMIVKEILDSEFFQKLKEGRVALDNTTFSTWNNCFTKGLWYGGLRRVPAKPRTPLIFGEAVHLALAKHLEGKSVSESIKAAVHAACEKQLDLAMDAKRNVGTLTLLLTSYFDHITTFPSERLVPLTLNGVPVVEKDFSVYIGTVLDDIKVYWNGIVDLVGYSGGNLWVIDHKTTSIMGEKFADDKYRSSQMLGYYTVVLEILRELGDVSLPKLRGCLINAMAMRSSGYEFKQFHLPYSPAAAEEFKAESLMNIRYIISTLLDMEAWYNSSSGEEYYHARCNREGCVSKYGRCDYFDLCQAPAQLRQRLAHDEGFFTTTKWNPGEEGHE